MLPLMSPTYSLFTGKQSSMYKEFYGFTTYPFSLTPDPQFLYLSKKHENCLHYLLYSLERGHGLIVLTGKIGTGKTLLLNILMKSLNEKTRRAHIVNTKLEFVDILKYISQEFGLESTEKSKIELLTNLKNFLFICENINEKAVIIIDEAQDLSVDVLEELRLLTNFETHEKKLLQIILVGQPQLEYILNLHIPEKSISHYTNHKPDENGPHANGITSHRDTTPLGFSVPSREAEGMEQVEKWQSLRDSGRRYRLALVAGLTSLSLLGAGF